MPHNHTMDVFRYLDPMQERMTMLKTRKNGVSAFSRLYLQDMEPFIAEARKSRSLLWS